MPSIDWTALSDCQPAIVAPPEASARFSPTSSSSVVASTNWSAAPGDEIRKVAVSPSAFSSSAAASVTTCHVLQFAGVNVRAAPLFTHRFVLPALRPTATATLPVGARSSRTKNRPSPPSRTLTFVWLSRSSGKTTGAGSITISSALFVVVPALSRTKNRTRLVPTCVGVPDTVPSAEQDRPSTSVEGTVRSTRLNLFPPAIFTTSVNPVGTAVCPSEFRPHATTAPLDFNARL